MPKNRSVKALKAEYYGKAVHKCYEYVASREEALRSGKGSASMGEFGRAYRLDKVKMVRPIERNPLYPERVLYELTFKKRGRKR